MNSVNRPRNLHLEEDTTEDDPSSPPSFGAMNMILTSVIASILAYVVYASGQRIEKSHAKMHLPPQAVFVDPKTFAVLGPGGSFRDDAFEKSFNPTSTRPPFFQVFDETFLSILGSTPSIREIAVNEAYAFAHEAPVYAPATDEVFFSSNDGGPLGMSDLEHNNVVFKLSLREAEAALRTAAQSSSVVNVSITALDLAEDIQMTNGGTGVYHSSLLLINSGRGPIPPSIALVNPSPPYNSTTLLDNFYGRQFNSLNDIKVHPTNGKIFFTDVTYGYLNHFRAVPQMPNQIYVFEPDTSTVRVVADGFDKCNGLAFTATGKTVYVADTGAAEGFFGTNQTHPSTIYAFDVDPHTDAFLNRRVFAYVDSGVPDGVQVDTQGNVYSGCGDGVHVWNSKGRLLGKFFVDMTSANMVFAGDGRLVILAETKVFLAHIAAKGVNLSGP